MDQETITLIRDLIIILFVLFAFFLLIISTFLLKNATERYKIKDTRNSLAGIPVRTMEQVLAVWLPHETAPRMCQLSKGFLEQPYLF